jgi:geranylgeranyl diphosphate synthase, type II
MSLQSYLEQQRQKVEARLNELVPQETEPPDSIHRAMRYSLFAGGKRIRPIFCLEAARVVSANATGERTAHADPADLEAIGCSLELVHTYSLIHDDLPALDNDDYRRGKLTCHKAFGEANAILAGDALLTIAFEVLATLAHTPGEVRAALVAELAHAAGTVGGMIAGQVMDLEATNQPVTATLVEQIHCAKTAALFRAAVRMGSIGACASAEQLDALSCFAEHAGLAFQIADDILDVESSTESLGKTAGKDQAQKKLTYPAVYGLERSREIAARHIAQANRALDPFGSSGARLKELAQFLVSRKA